MNPRIVALFATTLLLFMTVPLTSPTLASTPPTDGTSVTISEDTTWNQSWNMNGDVIVSAGVNLTVTADITLSQGSSLDVNGRLILDGGSLNAVNTPSDLQFWSAYGDTSTLFLPETLGMFTIEIFSAQGYNLSNYTVQWNDGPKDDMEGENFSIPGGVVNPLQLGGTLSFESILGEYGELVLDKIVVHRATQDNTYEVTELDYSGWLLRGDAGFSVNIDNGGELVASESSITGGQISINGILDATNTDFIASGPLVISGSDSSISMTGGGFDGSRDDHDILADTISSISLTNVNGTGGIVDLWERQMTQQILQFPGSGITFTLTGVGPQERTLEGLSMVDGTFVVPANYQQGPRVIEIGYADGSVWTEQATISEIEWFTAWGTFYETGGPLEHSENPAINFAILPQISVTSVEITKEAHLGKRATVMVTLENTGNADAGNPNDEIDSVAIECYDGGERADISPTYPATDVMAGSSSQVELRWGHAESGNATLVCNPLTPSQVAVEGALGGSSTESQMMVWSAEAEASPGMSPLLISLLVALIVGLGLVAYFTAVVGKEETRTITITREESDDELDDLEDL